MQTLAKEVCPLLEAKIIRHEKIKKINPFSYLQRELAEVEKELEKRRGIREGVSMMIKIVESIAQHQEELGD